MEHKMKSNKSSTKWNTCFKDCKEWENGYNKPPHVTVQNCIGKFLHKRLSNINKLSKILRRKLNIWKIGVVGCDQIVNSDWVRLDGDKLL